MLKLLIFEIFLLTVFLFLLYMDMKSYRKSIMKKPKEEKKPKQLRYSNYPFEGGDPDKPLGE